MPAKQSGLLDKLFLFKQMAVISSVYLFLSFAGCVMVVFRAIIMKDFAFGFLIWNLFLTWIPLLLSIAMRFAYAFYNKSRWRSLFIFVAGAIWIAFYPNAPYIITDFIHLSGVQYYAIEGYNTSFIIWYDFVMMSLFVLTGFLLGFVSLFFLQKLIEERFHKLMGWCFTVCVLFLSSYGIYLGRFIRWNSWDVIFNPVALMDSIMESFHRYAFAFTVTFGLFLFLVYIALYNLTNLNLKRVNHSQ